MKGRTFQPPPPVTLGLEPALSHRARGGPRRCPACNSQRKARYKMERDGKPWYFRVVYKCGRIYNGFKRNWPTPPFRDRWWVQDLPDKMQVNAYACRFRFKHQLVRHTERV